MNELVWLILLSFSMSWLVAHIVLHCATRWKLVQWPNYRSSHEHPTSTGADWVLMLCVAAASMGFLILNWPPAQIFMGDVGSTWLAFIIFALALLSLQNGWLAYTVWIVLGAVLSLMPRLLYLLVWRLEIVGMRPILAMRIKGLHVASKVDVMWAIDQLHCSS